MKRTVISFGVLCAGLLILLRFISFKVLRESLALEIGLALVALVFFVLGMMLQPGGHRSGRMTADERVRAAKDPPGLSDREYEVLNEISNGLSNREIAEKLYITESTVKSHVSNLMIKLNARRRTQAVNIARKLRLL